MRIVYFLACLFALASFTSCNENGESPSVTPEKGAGTAFITNGKTRLEIRQDNLAWAAACASRVPDDKTQTIDARMYQLCRTPNFYQSAPTKFTLSKREGKIGMEYKIHFNLSPSDLSMERAAELLDMARACMPRIQEVWSRYGIWVNIEMDSDREPDNVGAALPLQQIALVDRESRSNAGTFYADDQDSFCRMMIHETGHHFGLEDEYGDSACPDRPLVSQERDPYSIMASIWGMGWNNMDFYGRHVKRVFTQYCGEGSGVSALQSTQPDLGDMVDIGFPE